MRKVFVVLCALIIVAGCGKKEENLSEATQLEGNSNVLTTQNQLKKRAVIPIIN